MIRTKLFGLVVMLMLCATCSTVMAQGAGGDADCTICEMKKDMSNSGVDVFLDSRIRQTYTKNMRSLDKSKGNDLGEYGNEQLYQRIRGRAGVTIKPTDWLSIGTRLVTEWRHYCKPDSRGDRNPDPTKPKAADDSPDVYALFDQGYVKIDGLGGVPASLTVGRQNIDMPSKWLIIDGTPLDGSRTLFFDALRFKVTFEQAMNTTLDIIGIRNRAEPDAYIKPFNYDNAEDLLSETDEEGLVVYLNSKGIIPDGELDGYFIYTHREDYEIDANNNQSNNKADIYTAGARLAGKLTDCSLSYYLEGAIQFGRREDIDDIDQTDAVKIGYVVDDDENLDGAFGINSRLTYDIGGSFSPTTHIGYEYRSGDSDSGKGFDILWGRAPTFSELFQGGFDGLDNARPAMSNNFHRFNLGVGVKPIKDMSCTLDYNLLVADNPNLNTAAVHSTSPVKGHLFKAEVKLAHNEHLSSRVTTEMFLPGGYYSSDNNDVATFARYELTVKW